MSVVSLSLAKFSGSPNFANVLKKVPCRLAALPLPRWPVVKLVATESLRVLGALSYPLFTSQLRVFMSTGRPVPDQEVYSLPKITSKTEGWDACRSRRLPLPSQLHRSFVTLVLVLMAVFLSVLQEVRGPITVSSGWEKVPRQSAERSEDQMHENPEVSAPESPVEVSPKVLMEVSTNQPLSELQCPC